MTLWQGRLSGETADVVKELTVSVGFDWALASEDLRGSRAHVQGLGRCGVLSDHEVSLLSQALDEVSKEVETGTFVLVGSDEDVHTAIERRVTELAGEVGAKLHTGRSRNDQVATDLRRWAKRELAGVARDVAAWQEVLLARA
ncbi:MAG: lyase family protein, partial [Acidimicrobiales bacterium]